MKKIICFITSFLITLNLFCYTGVLSGAKEIKIVKTKWFDIIYPAESEKTAAILYDNADRIYEEVTKQYGLLPSFRMPVVITDQVDTYNAFSTPVPYNRIVLYNTTTNNLDDSSALDQLFLTTFRHELTHTITFNIKNNFWDGVTNIFGDAVLPGCFFITPGLAEGAAVASESALGDGRLNDEFATHFVKQAKIENSFPGYYDVQGANSSSSLPLHYYFNGPFHAYLQKKYGMEKYAEFWHRIINLNRPGVNLSFRKTYGTSIRKEWKSFEESYEIPSNIINPLEKEIAKDFFLPGENTLLRENNSGLRYSDLQNCDAGLFFSEDMFRNKNAKEIFFVSNENLNNEKIKPKSICTQQLIEGFTVSKDGRFVVISYYSTASPNIKSKIKILDLKNNSEFYLEEDSIKNGAVIKNGDDYYVVYHNYTAPNANIIIKKLVLENDNISSVKNVSAIPLGINTFASNFTDMGKGNFAFIKKHGANFVISVCDISGANKDNFYLPKGVRIRQLSENNGELYFSWVKKGTMARFGSLNTVTGKFTFSNLDVSGGIFNPVLVNYADAQRVAYIGCFFNENRLLTIGRNSQILTDCYEYTNTEKTGSNTVKENKYSFTDISSISQPYNRIKNLHKGIFVPVSLYSSDLIGENYGTTSPSQMLPFGITYITTNPWNGGNVTDDLFILIAGWSYLTNSFGIETFINQGTGTSLFSTSLDLKTEFDRSGWKQSGGELVLSSGFHFGNVSSILFENDFKITGGRQNNLEKKVNYLNQFYFWDKSYFESCAPKNNNLALNISDIFSINYSSVHDTGPGRFEQLGIRTGVSAGYIYDTVLGHSLVINPSFLACFPGLIPVKQKRGFTYNLPVNLRFSLFPYASNYGLTGDSLHNLNTSVLDSRIEMVLFGLDVEKAIPYFEAFYINNFYISAGYCSTISSYQGYKNDFFQLPYLFEYMGNLSNGKSVYLDSVYLKMALKITPNIGLLANSSGMTSLSFYGQISYPLNVLEKKNKRLNYSFGFTGNF